jgi:hypothetical protein
LTKQRIGRQATDRQYYQEYSIADHFVERADDYNAMLKRKPGSTGFSYIYFLGA